jgi:hypothetical protein
METLPNYLIQVRRLIHDVSAEYWDDDTLIDYINSARNRVALDTGATRTIQQMQLTPGQTEYAFSALPQGNQTMEIIGVSLVWGSSVIPLGATSYTGSYPLRAYTGMLQRPAAWVKYGQGQFMVFPAPDQAYTINLDTILAPTPLMPGSPNDAQINYPYDELVFYYAARQAKIEMQSWDEVRMFEQLYESRVMSIHGSRQVINPYGR